MSAYYNEHDREKAAWLRELIKARIIAPGEVDERSIEDVRPSDLDGFDQCHFFAGAGVWSYALRLAGWPDDQRIWTGSCPCQPFSSAGQGKGFADERHLWPAWFHLIEECRPDELFGEQVASPAGRAWFDLVRTDLEGTGYASGPVNICAAGVGAPNIRQRLYWLANSGRQRRNWKRLRLLARRPLETMPKTGGCGETLALDLTAGSGRERIRYQSTHSESVPAGATRGFWSAADWIYCRDEKWRPIEPGTFPLAHGAPARVGRLRGYGDAINAEAAAEVIRAVMAIA